MGKKLGFRKTYEYVSSLHEYLKFQNLTNWESCFLSNILEQLDKHRSLTSKQFGILTNIKNKYLREFN
jgi:hypothetical protein